MTAWVANECTPNFMCPKQDKVELYGEVGRVRSGVKITIGFFSSRPPIGILLGAKRMKEDMFAWGSAAQNVEDYAWVSAAQKERRRLCKASQRLKFTIRPPPGPSMEEVAAEAAARRVGEA
eukprot:529747-Pelagomonas_calceolata.AAC.1